VALILWRAQKLGIQRTTTPHPRPAPPPQPSWGTAP
jgi:hypothetical protein